MKKNLFFLICIFFFFNTKHHVVLATNITKTLTPRADAFLVNDPADYVFSGQNFGARTTLELWNTSGEYRYTVIDFGKMPSHSSHIVSAKLKLFYGGTGTNSGTNTIKVSNYATGWNESSIAYLGKPSYSADNLSTTIACNSTTTNYEIDVTEMLQQKNSFYASFYLQLIGSNTSKVYFASKENGTTNSIIPQLEIIYSNEGFDIDFICDPNKGTISGTTSQNITDGGSSTLVTASAKDGYVFTKWQSSNGETLSTDYDLIIDDVDKDDTVTAIFEVGETKNIEVNKDAFVRRNHGVYVDNYIYTNYGTEEILKLRCSSGNFNTQEKVLIDFGEINIPVSQITRATLLLKNNGTGNTGETEFKVSRYIKSWNETEVTWSNMPSLTSDKYVIVPSRVESYFDYEIDVLSLITGTENNSEFGFHIELSSPDEDLDNTVTFASKENSNSNLHPYLSIKYIGNLFTLALNAAEHGSLSGETTQVLYTGTNSQAVTAIADDGYRFVEWQNAAGEPVSRDNPLSINEIDKDYTLTAIFKQAYNVTFSAGENGTVTGELSQSIPQGLDASPVTAVPNEGYKFVEWRNASGNSISNENPLTLINVIQDSSLIAAFEIINYTISLSAGDNGSITPVGDVTINYNNNLTFTVTPDAGYTIDEVYLNGNDIAPTLTLNNDGSYSYELSSITDNFTISATFKELPEYTLSASAGNHGQISPSGEFICNANSQDFVFIPDDNYVVSKVYVDDSLVTFSGYEYELLNISSNHSIRVEFEEFNGNLSLFPLKDAYVYFNDEISERMNTNYGENKSLLVKYEEQNLNEWHSFIGFSDLKTIFDSLNISSPSDMIDSVKLNLHHILNETETTGEYDVAVNILNDNWNENEVNFVNQPSIKTGEYSPVIVPLSSSETEEYTIDVTDLFLAEYNASENKNSMSFSIDFNDKSGDKELVFCSKENGNVDYAPQLIIKFKEGSVTPPTGIEEMTNKNFQVYPNPTTDIVQIKLPVEMTKTTLSVYSLTGNLVYIDPDFYGGKVDLSDFSKGIYLLELKSETDTMVTKIIKK